MTIAHQLQQKGIEKGLQLGEQKARLEIAVKLLESGKSFKFVKEKTELSEEELAKFPTDRQSLPTQNALLTATNILWRRTQSSLD